MFHCCIASPLSSSSMVYSVTSEDMTNESSFLSNDTVEPMNFNPSSANSNNTLTPGHFLNGELQDSNTFYQNSCPMRELSNPVTIKNVRDIPGFSPSKVSSINPRVTDLQEPKHQHKQDNKAKPVQIADSGIKRCKKILNLSFNDG